jgi:Hsp20/alpha crystallin family
LSVPVDHVVVAAPLRPLSDSWRPSLDERRLPVVRPTVGDENLLHRRHVMRSRCHLDEWYCGGDVEKVKAEYQTGVLTVTLSKKEVAKPKTIRVEINNN